MPDVAAPLPRGELIAGRFRVIRRVGSGAMGDVYEVEHELTKHRRALKLLNRAHLDMADAVSRFLREASAAGRIGSRHIVETFDAGQLATGEPYLVMELLRGETLADRLARQGALAIESALEIVRQAAIGIQSAHDAGIVHRDLKPENLFLMEGPEPEVKILDFGISKFDPELTGTPSLTTDGTTLGTPYYMAPEQVRGGNVVDARSDVYALGVVLYECLIGRPPFVAESLPALCVLIHEGDYQRPRQLRPELPSAVEDVVVRAMAREPGQRFQTASALAHALGQLREGRAVSLQDTLAVASLPAAVGSARPAIARSLAPPAPNTLDPAAQTELSVAFEGAAPVRNRRALLLLGGVAFAALAAALIWNAGRDRSTTAEMETIAAPAPSDVPLREVEPLASAAPLPAELSAKPSRGLAPPAALSRPAPQSSKPSGPSTRAKEHGLGTQDPFGP